MKNEIEKMLKERDTSSKKIVHYKGMDVEINEDFASKYVRVAKKIDELSCLLKKMDEVLKPELMGVMERLDKKQVVSNGISASMKCGYYKNTLDTKRLKDEDIDTYNKYLGTSYVNGSLSIKY